MRKMNWRRLFTAIAVITAISAIPYLVGLFVNPLLFQDSADSFFALWAAGFLSVVLLIVGLAVVGWVLIQTYLWLIEPVIDWLAPKQEKPTKTPTVVCRWPCLYTNPNSHPEGVDYEERPCLRDPDPHEEFQVMASDSEYAWENAKTATGCPYWKPPTEDNRIEVK